MPKKSQNHLQNISRKKKFFICTFGCQMNEYDSQCIAGQFLKQGFIETKIIENADIIIFNTCSVREHAKDRFYRNLFPTSLLKAKKSELIVGVCGCIAEQEGYKIFDKFPWVRLIAGPGNIACIGDFIKRIIKNGSRIIEVGSFEKTKCDDIDRNKDKTALVTIIRGCDNFCSYCVVPFVRGRETSRLKLEIIEEIKKVAKQGYKEVMLLGQNVCAYKDRQQVDKLTSRQVDKKVNERRATGDGRRSKNDFAELLTEVSKINGIERIKFMTSHPRDFDKELVNVVAELPKVAKEFHLPVQSGSDKILKEMNRGYTKKYYIDLLMSIRQKMPQARITTDIIVGFPGETEEDFKDTLDLIEKVKFDGAFMFKYSDRPNTKAEKKNNKISEGAKEQRLKVLQERIDKGIKDINELTG